MMCQLPLLLWPVNVFIGMGSSRYEKLFYNFFHRKKCWEILIGNEISRL
jgi:hypothetical protein